MLFIQWKLQSSEKLSTVARGCSIKRSLDVRSSVLSLKQDSFDLQSLILPIRWKLNSFMQRSIRRRVKAKKTVAFDNRIRITSNLQHQLQVRNWPKRKPSTTIVIDREHQKKACRISEYFKMHMLRIAPCIHVKVLTLWLRWLTSRQENMDDELNVDTFCRH